MVESQRFAGGSGFSRLLLGLGSVRHRDVHEYHEVNEHGITTLGLPTFTEAKQRAYISFRAPGLRASSAGAFRLTCLLPVY